MPPFLRGAFQTFPLAEVFAVLGLSRQLFAVRFSDTNREVGTIAVKAGRVIGAWDFRTRTEGADALKALIDDPGAAFAVVMLPPNTPETPTGAAICTLAELLPETDGGSRNGAPAPMAEHAQAGSGDPSSQGEALGAAAPQSPPAALPDAGTGSDPPRPPPRAGRPAGGNDVILHGTVDDASFEEILEVLQLSELSLAVSFIRAGAEIGTLTLRSEQVLAAAAGSLQGVDAFKQLYADHGETYEVRRAGAVDESNALGGVTGLLAAMRPPPLAASAAVQSAPQGGHALFMRGRLSDFPLELLIGSLDLTRQPIELVLRRDDRILHRVRIKSGHIAAAGSASGESGGAALAAIREDPGDEFLVYRCAGPVDGSPVATLQALLPETGPAPDSIGQRPALPAGPTAAPPAAGEAGVERGGPSATPGKVAGSPAPPEPTPGEAAQTEMVEAPQEMSQAAVAIARLLVDLEDTHNGVIQEIRAALATIDPGRRERILLWSILGVQLGCLAVTLGVLALAF